MTAALARALLTADAIAPEALAEVLFVAASEGVSLVRALVATASVDARLLQQILDQGGVAGDVVHARGPYMLHIAPVVALIDRVPPGLCDRLFAVPVRSDPHTRTVDLAVVDALDPHPVAEFAHWLGAPVRAVRTSVATMEVAIASLAEPGAPGVRALAPPIAAPLSNDEQLAALEGGWEDWDDEDVVGPLSTPRRIRLPPETLRHVAAATPSSHATPIPSERLPPPHPSSGARPRGRESRSPPASLPPPMRAGARSSQPPPFGSFAATVSELRVARERDAILSDLVRRASAVSARVAILAVHRNGLLVWSESAAADRDEGRAVSPEVALLKGMRIEKDLRNVFGDALASSGTCFGRVASTAEYAALATALGSADLAMVTVRVEHRPVAIVLASGLTDRFTAPDRLRELAGEAGEALRVLLRRRHV